MDREFLVGAFSAIGGMVATIVTAYIALRNVKPNQRILKSQETSSLATAAETAAGALVDILKAFSDERKQFELRIDELEAHREERTKRIEELENSIESLNREYAAETQSLKEKIDDLQTQVTDGKDRYDRLVRVNEKLVQALKDASIPLPDIEADLTDSQKLRWQK